MPLMKTENSLSVAIYYNRNEWNYLMKAAIVPFLNLHTEDFFESYIFLADYRGQHIRLLFRLKPNVKKQFSIKIESYFGTFLKDRPSIPPEPRFVPGASLWMNFRNNSIETENFRKAFAPEEPYLLTFSLSLSSLLISTFVSAEPDEPVDIVELGILTLLRLITYTEQKNGIGYLKNCLRTVIETSDLNRNTPEIKKVLRASSRAAATNKHILTEYLQEAPDNEITACLYAWQEATALTKAPADQIQRIIQLIQFQLGLNELSKLYSLNIIRRYLVMSDISHHGPS
jgi:hypothetical protein